MSVIGITAAAALEREQNLKNQIEDLKTNMALLGSALTVYRKQHDAGYKDSHCTCVNCVWTTNILDKTIALIGVKS